MKPSPRVYLYGLNSVLAALCYNQRSFYKLFVKQSSFESVDNKSHPWFKRIVDIARKLQLPTVTGTSAELKHLTNARPHKGVALECGLVPEQVITKTTIATMLNEMRASNHVHNQSVTTPDHQQIKRPLLLYVEHLTDVMNFGNIVRSAAFFGAYGIIFSSAPCVAQSALISKLSVGALESLKLFRLSNPILDLRSLVEAGFLLTGTAGRSCNSVRSLYELTSNDLTVSDSTQSFSDISPRPLILALGSESNGLTRTTLDLCNIVIRIPGYADDENSHHQTFDDYGDSVSSLNVATSADSLIPPMSFSSIPNSSFDCDEYDEALSSPLPPSAFILDQSTLGEGHFVPRLDEDQSPYDVQQIQRLEQLVGELKVENRQLKDRIERQASMRSYMNLLPDSNVIDSPPSRLDQSDLPMDNVEFNKLREENEQLKKELSSCRVQLRCLENVLELQESKLKSDDSLEKSDASKLLAFWRCKVFSLLYKQDQLKSQHRSTLTRLDQSTALHKSQLDQAEAQNQTFALKLEACRAKLDAALDQGQLLTTQRSDLEVKLSESEKCHKELLCRFQQFTSDAQTGLVSLISNSTQVREQVGLKLRRLQRVLAFIQSRLQLVTGLVAKGLTTKLKVIDDACLQVDPSCFFNDGPVDTRRYLQATIGELYEWLEHFRVEAMQAQTEREALLRRIGSSTNKSHVAIQHCPPDCPNVQYHDRHNYKQPKPVMHSACQTNNDLVENVERRLAQAARELERSERLLGKQIEVKERLLLPLLDNNKTNAIESQDNSIDVTPSNGNILSCRAVIDQLNSIVNCMLQQESKYVDDSDQPQSIHPG